MKRVPLQGNEPPSAQKPNRGTPAPAFEVQAPDVDEQSLRDALTDPLVHQQLRDNLLAPYSLGVGRPAETRGKLALVARVSKPVASSLVTVERLGKTLPVLVIGHFESPVPL